MMQQRIFNKFNMIVHSKIDRLSVSIVDGRIFQFLRSLAKHICSLSARFTVKIVS